MPPPDFYGPELKAERAEHHVDHLEAIFTTFIEENRQAFIANAKNKGRDGISIGASFPKHTPTVIGDAIHNLRASLDHAYCILVETNGHTTTRHTLFPFGKDRDSMAGSINGQIAAGHGPSGKARDVILDKIQPFMGGNGEWLYGIHKLDIADKHQVLIPTTTKIRLDKVMCTALPSGSRVMFDTTISTSNPEVQKNGFLNFLPGSTVFDPNQESKITFEIGFQKGQPFEGEGVIHTLRDLLILTQSTIKVLRSAA